MVNVPSVPEIITVNSEALQEQIRDLLPSQNGFGSELQASNVITPIIDLTRAAEGSTTPELLQTALAYGSQTAFVAVESSVTIANSPGFYRVTGTAGCHNRGTGDVSALIIMTDGSSPKTVWGLTADDGTTPVGYQAVIDLVFFLDAGVSLVVESNHVNGNLTGSIRQIATGDGTLVQPNGFPL